MYYITVRIPMLYYAVAVVREIATVPYFFIYVLVWSDRSTRQTVRPNKFISFQLSVYTLNQLDTFTS